MLCKEKTAPDRFAIREAVESDIPRLLEIYGPYVEHTTVSFEYEVPSEEEFRQRLRRIKQRYPYLVCEQDHEVIGYAYADTYMIRTAYDRCAEISVYVDRDKRGQGAGKRLYEALFSILRTMHILNLYAVITAENRRSLEFHKALGFSSFAVFHKAGYKQGRWLDVVWMERFLDSHEELPKPVRWAEQLRDEGIL